MNLFKSEKQTDLYCGVVFPAVIDASNLPIPEKITASSDISAVKGLNFKLECDRFERYLCDPCCSRR